MQFSHREVTWPYETDSILDLQPTFEGNWALLTGEGVCAIVDDSGTELLSKALSLDGLDLDKPVLLRLSRDRQLAVIAEEFGVQGRLFAVGEGKLLMDLTRSDYFVSHCSYPIAFFERGEQTLLVHSTDWNRLDVSDPVTGACLTDRPSPKNKKGAPRPLHYLDYFHSRLTISPDQKRIFDNGWEWHPLGIPRTWSLEAWAGGNVWESEDGESVRELHTGGHVWDAPMAWIDERTVAVWGLGEELDEEQPLRPGVRIFDVISGGERAVIEDVQVEPHALSPRNLAEEGWIAFDKWLYAVSPNYGTSVWDLDAQKCLYQDPQFTPRNYNPPTQTFISLKGAKARMSRLEAS